MKLLLLVAIFALISTGCSSQNDLAVPPVAPTPAAIASSPIPSSTFTVAPAASPTIIPSATFTAIPPTLVETPLPAAPGLVWGPAAGRPVELNLLQAFWSPAANELAGIASVNMPGDIQRLDGTLTFARAPDFTATVFEAVKDKPVYAELTWTPDGQKILYGVAETTGVLGVDYFSSLWAIGRDGSNPRPLQSEHPRSFSGLRFYGWMDAQTLIYGGYAGGGHLNIEQYDFAAQEILLNDIVHVSGAGGALHPAYFPVVDCYMYCTTCVLTREPEPQPSSACRSMQGHTRQFPLPPQNYPRAMTEELFQDWLPGTNTMLILIQGVITDVQVARLLLWDVGTDKVTGFVPGALSGKYSPDGKVAAFVTRSPFDAYPNQQPGDISLTPVLTDGEPYLQIMDVRSRQILFSAPVRAWLNQATGYLGILEAAGLSFSPDGRDITFLTNGVLHLQNENLPTEVSVSEPPEVHLNILDLSLGHLVQSLPLAGFEEHPLDLLWSPDSQKLIYQDVQGNWQLCNLAENTTTALTLSGGEQLMYPAWSFDGSYLSFSSRYDLQTGISNLYILNLNERP